MRLFKRTEESNSISCIFGPVYSLVNKDISVLLHLNLYVGINFSIVMTSKGHVGVSNETQVIVLTLLNYFNVIKVDYRVIFLFTFI